jgi:hypothetical protein
MAPKTLREHVAEEAKAEQVQVSLNLDDYTLREKIDLELALGSPLGELFPAGKMLSYRALAGLAWLTKRRTHPTLAWDAFVDSGDENWTGVRPDPTEQGESPGGEPERSPDSSEPTQVSA